MRNFLFLPILILCFVTSVFAEEETKAEQIVQLKQEGEQVWHQLYGILHSETFVADVVDSTHTWATEQMELYKETKWGAAIARDLGEKYAAFALFDDQYFSKAIPLFQWIIENYPVADTTSFSINNKVTTARVNLAMVYFRQGKIEEAKTMIQSLPLKPDGSGYIFITGIEWIDYYIPFFLDLQYRKKAERDPNYMSYKLGRIAHDNNYHCLTENYRVIVPFIRYMIEQHENGGKKQ